MPTTQYGFPTLEERRAAQLEKAKADQQRAAQEIRDRRTQDDHISNRYRALSPLVHSVLREYGESYGFTEDQVLEGSISDPIGTGNIMRGWMFTERSKAHMPPELTSLTFLLFGENTIYMLCNLARAESDKQYREELSNLRNIISRKTECNVRVWIFNHGLKRFREAYNL